MKIRKSEKTTKKINHDVEMIPYPNGGGLYFAVHPSRQTRGDFKGGFLTNSVSNKITQHVLKQLNNYLATPTDGKIEPMTPQELQQMVEEKTRQCHEILDQWRQHHPPTKKYHTI